MLNINDILPTIKQQYPNIVFKEGKLFAWSSKDSTVTYSPTYYARSDHAVWALIHELAHATLSHDHYKNDVDLLRHEVSAWSTAKHIAAKQNVKIDEAHIQDCLDTYRDWLHKRATCPSCSVVSLQGADGIYSCFNCQTKWKVPNSPLCRISRRIIK